MINCFYIFISLYTVLWVVKAGHKDFKLNIVRLLSKIIKEINYKITLVQVEYEEAEEIYQL